MGRLRAYEAYVDTQASRALDEHLATGGSSPIETVPPPPGPDRGPAAR